LKVIPYISYQKSN